ncbi:MAG: hypothetical protein ACFB20_09555 [Opitutales bacterium]
MAEAAAAANRKPRVIVCSNVDGEQLRFLEHCLQHAGYDTERFTPIGAETYRRLGSGGRWGRLCLRLRMYLGYALGLVWKALRTPKEALFVVTSNGFHAPWLAGETRALVDAPVVHLLYDLFPDALEVAGSLQRASIGSAVIGALQRRTQRVCAGTVYLGAFLQAHAQARWGEPRLGAVIDVSAEPVEPPPALEPPGDALVFRYGGQLGWMHEAELLADCIRAVLEDPPPERPVRFELHVSGARAPWMREALADLPGVEVGGVLPPDEWKAHASRCHVGLATLLPGGATVCLPSKGYGLMSHGLALLALCPAWSDLARLVAQSRGGWVVPTSPPEHLPEPAAEGYFDTVEQRRPDPDVVADFKATVHGIAGDPEGLARARRNALHAMRTTYGVGALAQRWDGLLQAVAASRRSHG